MTRTRNSGYTQLQRDVFFDMWQMLSGDPLRINLVPRLKKQQVKELKEKDCLTDVELNVAKTWFPKLFKVAELNESELKHSALYQDSNKIRYINDLDPEFVDKWVNCYISDIRGPTLEFIMESRAFTDAQKIAVLYKHNTFVYSEEKEQKIVDGLKAIFAAHSEHPERLERALTTRLWYCKQSDEEIKDMVIQAFSLGYKQPKPLSIIGRADDRLQTIAMHKELNDVHKFVSILVKDLVEEDNIFDVGYHNIVASDYIRGAIESGIYTYNDIKECHLEHLVSNSQKVLSEI